MKKQMSNNDSNMSTTINHSNGVCRISTIKHFSTIDKNNMNQLLKQSNVVNNNKRRRTSKTINNVKAKRSSRFKSQSTIPISSHQNISHEITTSNLANKQNSWTNTPTLSSNNITTTTIATSDNFSHDLTDVSWTTLNNNHDNTLIDYLDPHNESLQTDHDLEELFQLSPNRSFNTSTSPSPSVATFPHNNGK